MKNWLSGRRVENLAARQQRRFNEPHIYRYLQWQYEQLNTGTILQGPQGPFPVIYFPLPSHDISDLQKQIQFAAEDSQQKVSGAFSAAGSLYLQNLRQQQAALWNGHTYVMTDLTLVPELQLTLRPGRYYDALQTCDLLEYELLTAGSTDALEKGDFPVFAAGLSVRNRIHQHGNPLLSACSRSAALGISVLIVYYRGDAYHVMLRSVSPKLTAQIPLLHTVPSLMMERVGDDALKEVSIVHNIYREYLEEVLEMNNGEIPGSSEQPDIYADPNLKFLQDLLRKGGAQLYVTGIAMDLMKLRPEICTLLLIDDPAWAQRHLSGESSPGALQRISLDVCHRYPLPSAIYPGPRLISLELDNHFTLPEAIFRPELFSPPGAAALYLGLNLARRGAGSQH